MKRTSTLARGAEHVFLVHAGREQSVAATKTYTGQLLLLYLLAYALGANIALDDLARLPEWSSRALSWNRRSPDAPSATDSWTTRW